MTKNLPAVYIALPVLCEHENLPAFLENLVAQDYPGAIRLFVCVNQPGEWWDNPDKLNACYNNAQSMELLKSWKGIDITLIDRSSKGKGWKGRQHGVGFARRETMEAIVRIAKNDDIIVSLDADTSFSKNYLSSIVATLHKNPGTSALSVPYYHKLTLNEAADRAILRYEIYMRCYAINLLRINSPYAFTALGSAMALTVKNYKDIGGITPKLSGEDFYFLQKLRKKGPLATWSPEKVYPAARFSDRVYFGTGPAMIKGVSGDWSSYPIYHHTWFDEVKKTYDLFPSLFLQNIKTPLDDFLNEIFPGELIWEKLRKNSASPDSFVWACHQKIGGLRVLQYLKWKQRQSALNDEQSLLEFLDEFYPGSDLSQEIKETQLNFSSSPIVLLNRIRDFLVQKEEALKTKIQSPKIKIQNKSKL